MSIHICGICDCDFKEIVFDNLVSKLIFRDEMEIKVLHNGNFLRFYRKGNLPELMKLSKENVMYTLTVVEKYGSENKKNIAIGFFKKLNINFQESV